MFKLTARVLCVAFLGLVVSSCRRLPEMPTPGVSQVPLDTLSSVQSVPSDYGALKAVSHNPNWPEYFQLWFEDSAGNLRIVPFDATKHEFRGDALVITRN